MIGLIMFAVALLLLLLGRRGPDTPGCAALVAELAGAHLERVAEAEKRDHRKLAQEMDLFHLQQEALNNLAVGVREPGQVLGELYAGRRPLLAEAVQGLAQFLDQVEGPGVDVLLVFPCFNRCPDRCGVDVPHEFADVLHLALARPV